MRSRRLTIFCVAMIALAGTPRAWREAGKLLSFAQHKAQVKFWSMVLPNGEAASARGEMVAAAQPLGASYGDDATSCPTQTRVSWVNRASGSPKANRRTASVPAKAGERREADIAPASHASLVARALKAPRGDGGTESLIRSRTAWEHQPSAIAGNNPAALILTTAATLPHAPASKSDTFRFVMIPVVAPDVSALGEKEAALQLKLLKKSLEDGKLLRQRHRLPVSRGMAASPAS